MAKKFSSFDQFCMKEALKQANLAFELGEVPIGAVIAKRDQIIAAGYNQVESLQDASKHAEMVCMQTAAAALGDWRLIDTTLYVTLEPCVMCAGALILFRVPKVIYGAKDLRHGGVGSYINVYEKSHPIHTVDPQGGLMEQESKEILQQFFQKRREGVQWNKKKLSDSLKS